MYLTEPKLFDIVKKQFIFKMNASGAAFTTLIILQIITSLTGTIGTGRFPKFSEYPNVEFILTSNDGSVALTILWAIILGGLITSNARKKESFAFVSTRISHHLSNMIFMLTASIISGITAALMGSAIKLFAFLKYGDIIVNTPGLLANPTEFFARIIVAIAYTLLFFLVGYTIGSFIARKIWFILVVLLIGWIFSSFILGFWNGPQAFEGVSNFYGNEQSIALFLIKIIVTVITLFAVSVATTNKLEVRS